MSQDKTERQLNLVICLLATRRFLSAQEIRATVHGYGDAESDSAFKRMFERDKKELRAAGIPIEMGGHDAFSDEDGYRISRADYELEPIELRPDEAAVLGLAARAWRHAVLGEAASNALLKLRAAGVPVDSEALPSITPVLGTDEPAFLPIWQAVRDRRPVGFEYRKPGAEPSWREVEPWGVVNVQGRWYVAGYDRDRADRRVFRLGRIVGDVRVHTTGPAVRVPDGVDVRSVVRARPVEPDHVATLRVRADSAHVLRRAARRIVPGDRPGDRPGWDLLEYPYSDEADMAARIAEYGEHVLVQDPPGLRAAVIGHLRAVAESGAEAADTAEESSDTGRGGAPRRAGASSEQLRRLLMLVPYALSHDVRVSEVAAHFGLPEKQVLKDLSLLWMCGLPGYTPGDLIDVDVEAAAETGEIIIGNADTLAAPLRLTADEAASLVVGIELLSGIPGVDSDALKRVGEKLRAVAGAAVGLADAVEVRVELDDEVREMQRRAGEALEAGQRLHLRYLSGYEDRVTERDVDPMRLVIQDGQAFLEGWCRLRSGVRLFRLDRVLDLTVLPVAAQVPTGARGRDLSDGVLQFSGDDAYVSFELTPAARWVAEDYVCAGVRELPGGHLRATLRTPEPAWAVRLALRLGPTGRLVAPAELADRAREQAGRAVDGYRDRE
ncbi:helix-turn-helix transcriptional regulator [Actinorugispora endophytica]|uniref:Transcriptional regulator n=1 Tax=Actinorugispora endophytica TaxID=1605990 RepID=A0A4R6UK76_9ACTN|nr:WYL domain-containing protein [Actinorugispora endophytica]TDQ45733.1 transcriptional regulator [Actinorugispora endophytica]